MRNFLFPLALWFAIAARSSFAVDIDGRISPGEWEGATHIRDFRKVQPFNGEPASLTTEGWILATPEGLAIAFRNSHPESVPRTEQRVQRDFEDEVDRVNVMVDFDGDGQTGYAFTLSSTNGIYDAVITNEWVFNSDWDGNWRHAVEADEHGWTAEVLIPWHIAPMRKAAGETRTLRIYLDRVIAATGERAAWPLASTDRSRFLSDFAPIEVTNYVQALLALTPYALALHDEARSRERADGGLDVFWKINGQMQLAATVNPDFGHVESDDLVINFNATETFFSDKRPFFTENQGIFEFTTPSEDSQLLYTRRIGGPADDGNGLGDIVAAVKLNGSVGRTKFGVLLADEDEEVGRTFSALRVVSDFASQNLGLMVTNVERPYFDREATAVGIDHNWRPTDAWNVRTRLIGSQIEQVGERTRGDGASLWVDYQMDGGWRQQWVGMHFADDLQINDAGYLYRNSLNYAHWQVQRRFDSMPASSRYASTNWRTRASVSRNDHGELLTHQWRLAREGRLRNGAVEYEQIFINSAGVDDLLLRGHGNVRMPANFSTYFKYERPRKAFWGWKFEADVFSDGLAGNDEIGYAIHLRPTYFLSDALNIYVGLYARRIPDWVLWQRENLIASFSEREARLNAGFNWIISGRQELRLKLQAIGLDARFRRAYRVDASGNAHPSDDPVDDFSVRNLGVQLRYRFEVAPLSYLYVVYGRGGYVMEPYSDSPERLVRRSFTVSDEQQLLVKFSYRFEF